MKGSRYTPELRRGHCRRLGTAAGLTTLLVVLAAGLLGSCPKAEQPRPEPLGRGEISGARLWKRITMEADYENWDFWPGYEGAQPGQSPHGKFHKVYISSNLKEALPIADRRAPDGSIIVKENLDAEKKPTGLTVMAKVAGYDPEHNDWFWAKYGPDGQVQGEGKPAGCIGCHEGMADNDYIIIRRLDAPVSRKAN